ncbi:glucose-1-phosphate cytidylyltransferase [Geomonas sp. Red32]|uniref:sugar phosphate nucleotidyltransferase n=1 Tax=Geomonas sp. Red32 TaxID=2912856 RepID=UPI00202CF787|nr:sugar phosphate nucleotidyltransferase [Geomonas sp. Red32]MCM0083333.1 glucose-1-phosphate cytidylyltransferase [Geomonas sp. Red32]
MKVVLFCGGLGSRLRDHSGDLPKPMVKIGYRPILWHLMKYYAHFGHKDFILCLGYRADAIKEYFLNYNEYVSNDFTIRNGGKEVCLEQSDIADWNITCVDTGLKSNIGQRFKAVEKYLAGEEYFLANYADGLCDLHLPDLVETFKKSGKVGCFLCVKPSQSFSVVSIGEGRRVEKIEYVQDSEMYINGGFFIFHRDIFQYINDGEELVVEPFQRLIEERMLMGYKYDRFWHCMDTYKEQQELNEMYEKGDAPWEIWNPRHHKGRR